MKGGDIDMMPDDKGNGQNPADPAGQPVADPTGMPVVDPGMGGQQVPPAPTGSPVDPTAPEMPGQAPVGQPTDAPVVDPAGEVKPEEGGPIGGNPTGTV